MLNSHQSWNEARLDAIIAEHRQLEGPLLPILHAIQEAFGHVPQAAVPIIATELNLSRAEVHGVVPSITISESNPPGTMS